MKKKRFGEIIREAREAKGLTQRELAELIGKSPSYISKIETGKRIPLRDVIDKLAEVLDLNPEELHKAAIEEKEAITFGQYINLREILLWVRNKLKALFFETRRWVP